MGEMDMLNVPRNPSGRDACGMSPCQCDEHGHDLPQMIPAGATAGGGVSREDCCEAVRCLVECCSCPVTKAALIECCDDILAGDYDR